MSSAPAPQSSQNQQILDLFSGSGAAPAPKQSALDDLLSLGLGSTSTTNGTNGAAPNGTNAFGAPAAGVTSSNPFADMFQSAPQQKPGFGGNGFAPMGMGAMGGMPMGMQMGMGAPQQQFYQQPPTIQQPLGANNVFGSTNDQGNKLNDYEFIYHEGIIALHRDLY